MSRVQSVTKQLEKGTSVLTKARKVVLLELVSLAQTIKLNNRCSNVLIDCTLINLFQFLIKLKLTRFTIFTEQDVV